MRRFNVARLGIGMLILIMGCNSRPVPSAEEKDQTNAPAVKSISEPVTYKNLSIFFLHGPDARPDLNPMSLEEAIEKKKIVVHETRNVNQLSIENLSNEEIFVHMGDMVRGGSQDRMIVYDMIVPPQSGKLPLPSFCVESGRWAGRGNEDSKAFNASKNQAGKTFKYAANSDMQQATVWANVQSSQAKLVKNLNAEVADPKSPSSLQLSLESKKVVENVAKYESAFTERLHEEKDVIGIAVAINGKVQSVDVYASAAMFAKFAKKLVNSACVDALSELDETKTFTLATSNDVRAMLEAKLGEPQEQDSNTIRPGNNRRSRGDERQTGVIDVPIEVQAPNPEINVERQTGVVDSPIQTGVIDTPVQNPPANPPGFRPQRVPPPEAPPQQLLNPPVQVRQPVQQPAHTPDPPDSVQRLDSPEAPKVETQVRIFKYENEKVLMVESREKRQPGGVLHRSYLAKDEKKDEPRQAAPRANPMP